MVVAVKTKDVQLYENIGVEVYSILQNDNVRQG